MIEPVPHRWRSVRATVGDSVEIPTNAESVSLLPAAEDSDEVTVSFFVFDFSDEFDRMPETESRPIETETIDRDELPYRPRSSPDYRTYSRRRVCNGLLLG